MRIALDRHDRGIGYGPRVGLVGVVERDARPSASSCRRRRRRGSRSSDRRRAPSRSRRARTSRARSSGSASPSPSRRAACRPAGSRRSRRGRPGSPRSSAASAGARRRPRRCTADARRSRCERAHRQIRSWRIAIATACVRFVAPSRRSPCGRACARSRSRSRGALRSRRAGGPARGVQRPRARDRSGGRPRRPSRSMPTSNPDSERVEHGPPPRLALEHAEEHEPGRRVGDTDPELGPDESGDARKARPGGDAARGGDPVRQRQAAPDRRASSRAGRRAER